MTLSPAFLSWETGNYNPKFPCFILDSRILALNSARLPPACHRQARRIASVQAYMAMAGRLPWLRVISGRWQAGEAGGHLGSYVTSQPEELSIVANVGAIVD